MLEPIDDQEQFNQYQRIHDTQSRAYLYLPKTPTRLQAQQYISYFDCYGLQKMEQQKQKQHLKQLEEQKQQSEQNKENGDSDQDENQSDKDDKDQEERLMILSKKKNWNKEPVVSMNTSYRQVQQNVAQVLNDSKSNIIKIVEIQEKNKIVRNLSSLDKIFEEARIKHEYESVQQLDLFKKQQLNYDINKLKLPEIPSLEQIQEKNAQQQNKQQSLVNNKSNVSLNSNISKIQQTNIKSNVSQNEINNLSQSNCQKDQFQNMKNRFQIKLPKNFLLVPIDYQKAKKKNSTINITKILKTEISENNYSNNILSQNTDCTLNSQIKVLNKKQKEMNKSMESFYQQQNKKTMQLPKINKKDFLLDQKLFISNKKVGGLTLKISKKFQDIKQQDDNDDNQNSKKKKTFINYKGIQMNMPKYLTPYRDLVLRQWAQNANPWTQPNKQESNLLSNCVGMLSLQEHMQQNTNELNRYNVDQKKEYYIVPTQLKVNQQKDDLSEKFGADKKNQKEQAYSLVSLLDKLVKVQNPLQVLKGQNDDD